jgi:hypothetical protein
VGPLRLLLEDDRGVPEALAQLGLHLFQLGRLLGLHLFQFGRLLGLHLFQLGRPLGCAACVRRLGR